MFWKLLSVFPFLTPIDLAAMKEEYPKYFAACEDVTAQYDQLVFWKIHESNSTSLG